VENGGNDEAAILSGPKVEETNMDEQEFRSRSDNALETLYKKLNAASDRYEFEPDFNSGALSIEFEEPKGRFVVSPNTPVRQIWVSAHSKSFKLEWDDARKAFVLPESGQDLQELIADAIEQQIGEEVEL
jgi:CyaY protein